MAISIVTRIHKMEGTLQRLDNMLTKLCEELGSSVPISVAEVEQRSRFTRSAVNGHRKRWTEAEEMRLMELVDEDKSYKYCARQLGRTAKAVQLQVSRIRRQGRGWLA